MLIENTQPSFSIDNYSLAPLTAASAESLLRYAEHNRDIFIKVWPGADTEFFTLDAWRAQLDNYARQFAIGKAVRFVLLDKTNVIGAINITDIHWGARLQANLGFSLDNAYYGKGLMRKALQAVLPYITETLGLTRIEANYQPDNLASEKLLQGLGFEREGYAKDYALINGEWRDHVLMSLTCRA